MKRIAVLFFYLILIWGIAGCSSASNGHNNNESTTSDVTSNTIQSQENKYSEDETITTETSNTTSQTEESQPLQPPSTTTSSTNTPTEKETSDDDKDDEESDTDAPAKENIPSTIELKNVGSLQYYLYIPSNPTSNMPLILYLHGGTNKKADVTTLLTTEGFPKYLCDGYYGDLRAYVAVPKLDNSYKGWMNISDQIRDLIKSLNTNYAIDMDKIALTGHSMGGTGTYQLQTKLPNTFACIAPMSGSIQNTDANLTALSKTKIWAFVGTEDIIVSPNFSREMIKMLKEKGANAKITELDGATHFDVPSLVYKNPDLIQWLVNCGE